MSTSPQTTLTEELGYYFPTAIYKQFKRSVSNVKKSNIDRFFIIDGREGEGGKSTFALQSAYACDRKFNLDYVVFNARDFERILTTSEKYRAIVFDEAFNGLSSKGALSKENKRLIRLIMECRQRNLIVFVVLPSIFLLEKYVAIFRSTALFHCFRDKRRFDRRYVKIYNYQKKKILYLLGKNMLDYRLPKIYINHTFYGKLPPTINEEEYKKKKLDAFRDNVKTEKFIDKQTTQRNVLIHYMYNELKIKGTEISKILTNYGYPLLQGSISNIIKDVSKNIDN